MKDLWFQLKRYGLLVLIVPLMSGCRGGGGSGDSLGSLLGVTGTPTGGGEGGPEVLAVVEPLAETGTIASLHTPEPATMLIMSTGFAAMYYMKNKNKKL